MLDRDDPFYMRRVPKNFQTPQEVVRNVPLYHYADNENEARAKDRSQVSNEKFPSIAPHILEDDQQKQHSNTLWLLLVLPREENKSTRKMKQQHIKAI